MTTPTDDNRDLVTVIAHMKAAEGKEDELRDALEALVEPTSQEEGCVNYDLHESSEEPGRFFFYENWESGTHLDAHLGAPHVQDFAARVGDLVDGGGLSVNRVRRIA